jgi:hypothetical protein
MAIAVNGTTATDADVSASAAVQPCTTPGSIRPDVNAKLPEVETTTTTPSASTSTAVSKKVLKQEKKLAKMEKKHKNIAKKLKVRWFVGWFVHLTFLP